jgi:hypothetical protein
MAPCATSITTTQLGRVLHWLFPSRRVVVAATVVEVAVSLLRFPLPVHVVLAAIAHVLLVLGSRA